MRHKQSRTNKLLKGLIVILILLLLFLLMRDFMMFRVATVRNINQTNQSIHNMQLELETLKVTNTNLIKLLATQHVNIKELKFSQTDIVDELNSIQQPITYEATPETTVETIETEVEEVSYFDNFTLEAVTIAVGTLELARRVVLMRFGIVS